MKARMIARMVGPRAISATKLSAETGIGQATLSRWLLRAAKIEAMPKKTPAPPASGPRGGDDRPQRSAPRTGAEKLSVVVRSEGLEGEALGEFLRREGVHLAELEQWRRLAQDALQGGAKRLPPSKETRRLQAELARKDKALAEAAALIILKKKVAEIWGDEDDDTDGTSDT
jgi:transposase-like protein